MATKTFNTRVANKRDTSSNWTTNNPVLLNGEIIIVDTEAGQVRYKVGNGTSTYTQLPFTDESLITNINGKLSLTGGTMTGNIAMGGHKVTGLGAPVDSNDAVRQADLKVVSDEVDGIIAGTTAITLPIADDTKLGGVKIGEGVNVAEDGTISVTPELPTGGTTGQVLTKTSTGEEWSDAPSGLPEGGTEGQVLKKGTSGAEWDNADWLPLSGGIMDNAVKIQWGTSKGASISSGVITPELRLSSQSINYVSTNLFVGGVPDTGNNVAYLNYDNNELRLHLGGKEENTVGRLTGLKTPVSSNEATPKSYVDTQLSTKLTTPTGTAGQLLGFTSDNTVGAVDAPESGLTQEQADERYLQLTGGELNDDAIFQLPGDNGSLYLGGRNNVPNVGMYASSSGYITLHDNTMGNVNIRGVRSPEFDYDAANKAYVDSKAPTSVAITLTTSGWSSNTQTVTVSGVSATETAQLITPTPAIASQSAYYEAGIMCTGQAANSLTFTCQTVPTSNLTVYVVIQPLS